MSGRWIEQKTPVACILDLVQAVESLQDMSVIDMPQSIRDLRACEQELHSLGAEIEGLLSSLDTQSIELAAEILEAGDDQLKSYQDRMGRIAATATADIQKATSLLSTYKEVEGRFMRHLEETKNVTSLRVRTSQGQKELEKTHGRFRYGYYYDEYTGGSAENLGWVDKISDAYKDVGTKRRTELQRHASSKSRTTSVGRVQALLESRVATAREAESRASNESLRRERVQEIERVAKKHGFLVNRKKVGKKVQYALVKRR